MYLSWASAEKEAYEQWCSNVFVPPANTDLRMEVYVAVSAQGITEEQIRPSVVVGSDLGGMTQRIHGPAPLGLDTVDLHHVGQEQYPFWAFGKRALPQLG
ncbi:hypothetical protein ACWG8W_14170 [Citricoccus zhacaiensis]